MDAKFDSDSTSVSSHKDHMRAVYPEEQNPGKKVSTTSVYRRMVQPMQVTELPRQSIASDGRPPVCLETTPEDHSGKLANLQETCARSR